MPPIISIQSRLKSHLKMAISRLRFVQQKKTAISKQQRRVVADLLLQGKEENAKIKVEHIILEDNYTELFEYLELYCELLAARIGLLGAEFHHCDPGLEEAVKVIIYSAFKTNEIKEIRDLKDLFLIKFGKEFAQEALDNKDNIIPEKIVKRCSVTPPSAALVNAYLVEIAKAYSVPYSGIILSEEEEKQLESEETGDDGDGDDDTAIEIEDNSGILDDKELDDIINSESGPTSLERRISDLSELSKEGSKPIKVTPPAMSLDNLRPEVKVPKGVNVVKKKSNSSSNGTSGAVFAKKPNDEFDDLKKRFEALKRN
ncbi:hypothetical protein PACTADRAFT_505 [Pachysolen tannophilus NRRL Y-2460]|uniref:Vacuolar protein sorting-associated protein IST1 n=1 Tax=Pachysolen tannophilus NRRL Y-2460 TaxID=669874 RepID=A0A1E4U1Y0_PACTA|nr:hypothetical protein PACTADRAFT_505 [Pachysolen tannophilus NRRL Y-2460]